MSDDIKKVIKSSVLSDVLLAEYILKKDDTERFNLDSRWDSSEKFYDYVVLYKIAMVLIVLLNIEKKNIMFLQVRLNFEKAIFTEGNIQKLYFYYEVKSAMEKLYELLDINNQKLDNLDDQNNKMPWTMACLRATGVLKDDQAILESRFQIIGMGWAMAWLRETRIIETNPAILTRFAIMWTDNYLAITDFLNEYDPFL